MSPGIPLGHGMAGDAWQALCEQVLRQEHGVAYTRVPDGNRGDAGIECFTDDGLAYQCYSPREPLSIAKRYEKHRDKMTEDVGKFIDNSAKLEPLFGGGIQVRYWILLVPSYDDRRIVEHANDSQTPRLRAAALSYAAADVRVKVKTLQEDFEASVLAIQRRQLMRLNLPEPGSVDFSALATDDVEQARQKLDKVVELSADGSPGVANYLNRLLAAYVGSREHIDYIRDHFSELGSALDDAIADLEVRLETEYSLSGAAPNQHLRQVILDTESRVAAAIPTLSASDAHRIALGQIADWLMRCPLDFVATGSPADGSAA